MEKLNRERVLAFRLEKQHLSEMSASHELLDVADMGIQNTPPGSALLALGTRQDNFSLEKYNQALQTSKTLIQLWSLRNAPYILPADDISVFTTGLLPTAEADSLFFMRGATAHLKRFDLSAIQVIEWTTRALKAILADGSKLTKDELGIHLAGLVGQALPASQRTGWNEPDGMRKNTYGQSIVRYALSVISLTGAICFAPPQGGRAARFMLTEIWLGHSAPKLEAPQARAELVRRFLLHLGPSDANGFASWAGVSPEFAHASWSLIAEELAPVTIFDRKQWLLARDLETIQSASPSQRVHLLPPHDPYLSAPDKTLLEPDQALSRRIWRIVGNPGVVLIAGEIAGIWHPKKKGNALSFQIELFNRPIYAEHASIEEAAHRIAALRQTHLASIEYL